MLPAENLISQFLMVVDYCGHQPWSEQHLPTLKRMVQPLILDLASIVCNMSGAKLVHCGVDLDVEYG